MKIILLEVFLFSFMALMSSCSNEPSSQDVTTTTQPNQSYYSNYTQCRYTSADVYANSPYMAFYDIYNECITVQNLQGSSWETLCYPYYTYPQSLSLSVDPSSGVPYVALAEEYNAGGFLTNSLTVLEYSGSSIYYVGSPDFSPGAASSVALLVTNGTPYVAFTDGAYSNQISVMYYNGNSWAYFNNAGFSGVTSGTLASSTYPSIASDGRGNFYVAYVDANNGNKVSVKENSGSGWNQVGSAGFSPSQAAWTSLAIDSSGKPYVIFEDYSFSNSFADTNGGKATVMYYSGSWQELGSPGFSHGKAIDTRIKLIGTTPYVSYSDSAFKGKIVVSFYNSTAWTNLGSSGITPGTAVDNFLAAGNSGNLYLAFSDWNTANTAYPSLYEYSSSWQPLLGGGSSFTDVTVTQLSAHQLNSPGMSDENKNIKIKEEKHEF